MGRKSRKRVMIKPFCYFCSREFDNEKILIQHQKAKHFKCGECNRKLETANGLAVHMQQVHKMVQRSVPNALEGRDSINSVVQGMNGIPLDIIEEYHLKHRKKMGDMNTKKQQRINWTLVTMAPSVEQFVAQMKTGNTYFPGFTAMPDNMKHQTLSKTQDFTSQYANVTPAEGGLEEFKTQPKVFSSSQPLILGPKGTPIDAPASLSNISIPTTTLRFTQPQKPAIPAVGPQLSGFQNSVFGEQNIPKIVPSQAQPNDTNGIQSAKNLSEESVFPSSATKPVQTVLYKNCGTAPLFIPTPALGTTKLAFSSDSVSIEELRAKIKYNWRDGI